jgi:hypothetical protein
MKAFLALSVMAVSSVSAQTAPAAPDPAARLEAHGELAKVSAADPAVPCFGARALTQGGVSKAVDLMWSEQEVKPMEEMSYDVDYSEIRPWLCRGQNLRLFAAVAVDGWALMTEASQPGELNADNSIEGVGGIYVSPAVLAVHAARDAARARDAAAAAAARPVITLKDPFEGHID